MIATIDAIYEKGVLKLRKRLPLPDKTPVKVTIRGPSVGSENPDRAAWLKLSEDNLRKTWENPDDDVFNELLKK